ncbi:hypothetical protein [Nocardia salmonicida]|uniref:hypothetical protein n=1 Tax=Nocardia salmonicida TaxID=53431 RepID=UPI002E2C9F7F|nr:hypothetical protein [Nocardia salmonicida]
MSAAPGTVKAVRLPDPSRREGEPVMDGQFPAMDSPVVVELHGRPHRYVVRVTRTADDGPVLTDLRILSDDSTPVDHAVLRSVNLRRLTHAALRYLASGGGHFAAPGEVESFATPEKSDDIRRHHRINDARLIDVAGHVGDALEAIKKGDPVQILEFVGERLNIGTAQAGRLIRKAKAEGLLPNKPLPRRKKVIGVEKGGGDMP